jgi:predicted metal-dependent hydrolase
MRAEDLEQGIALFNAGEFLKCHDYFEALIPYAAGRDAEFVHGLIELAAACYHLKQGNVFGARYLLTSTIDLLSACRPVYRGIDVEALLAQIERCRKLADVLEDDEDLGFDEAQLPRIRLGTPGPLDGR